MDWNLMSMLHSMSRDGQGSSSHAAPDVGDFNRISRSNEDCATPWRAISRARLCSR